MKSDNPFKQHLDTVTATISLACRRFKRPLESVSLLAVSKTKPVDDIVALASLGVQNFGENYLQEALHKIETLQDLKLTWHFIGPIQSNKTQSIAHYFDWVHSVDRLKIARRLSEQRPATLPPLNICLQVNISEEPTKSGCSPHELPLLIKQVSSLPNITLRGLMAIPQATDDFEQQRIPFKMMSALLNQAQQDGYPLDTLSMGMSSDIEAAIAEGATIVRVGTALFGARNYPPNK